MKDLVKEYSEKYFNLRKKEIISFIKENDELYNQAMNDGILWEEYNFINAHTDSTGISIQVSISGNRGYDKCFMVAIVNPNLIELYSILNKE